jgi:hypothetical protein
VANRGSSPLRPGHRGISISALRFSVGPVAYVSGLTKRLRLDSHDHLNRALVVTTEADGDTWAMNKLLRIPGTINHKYRGQPRVRLMWFDSDRLYAPQKLARRLGVPWPLAGRTDELDMDARGFLLKLASLDTLDMIRGQKSHEAQRD